MIHALGMDHAILHGKPFGIPLIPAYWNVETATKSSLRYELKFLA
jgi:hypothetical protein